MFGDAAQASVGAYASTELFTPGFVKIGPNGPPDYSLARQWCAHRGYADEYVSSLNGHR